MKEKADLEEESRRLDAEQKKLSMRARALYEKLIQEMRKKNVEKQQTVSQLQAKIGNLEAQLAKVSNAVSQDGTDEAPVERGIIAETDELEEASAQENVGAEDDVTVAGIEEEIELSSGQDRKKRKFF
jgi:uncharacterized coiled-coil protein SlyX